MFERCTVMICAVLLAAGPAMAHKEPLKLNAEPVMPPEADTTSEQPEEQDDQQDKPQQPQQPQQKNWQQYVTSEYQHYNNYQHGQGQGQQNKNWLQYIPKAYQHMAKSEASRGRNTTRRHVHAVEPIMLIATARTPNGVTTADCTVELTRLVSEMQSRKEQSVDDVVRSIEEVAQMTPPEVRQNATRSFDYFLEKVKHIVVADDGSVSKATFKKAVEELKGAEANLRKVDKEDAHALGVAYRDVERQAKANARELGKAARKAATALRNSMQKSGASQEESEKASESCEGHTEKIMGYLEKQVESKFNHAERKIEARMDHLEHEREHRHDKIHDEIQDLREEFSKLLKKRSSRVQGSAKEISPEVQTSRLFDVADLTSSKKLSVSLGAFVKPSSVGVAASACLTIALAAFVASQSRRRVTRIQQPLLVDV